jgi:hypothetical protein
MSEPLRIHTYLKSPKLCLVVMTDEIRSTAKYGEPPYETMIFPARRDRCEPASHAESYLAWDETDAGAFRTHMTAVSLLLEGKQPETSERDKLRKDIIFAKHELEEEEEDED